MPGAYSEICSLDSKGDAKDTLELRPVPLLGTLCNPDNSIRDPSASSGPNQCHNVIGDLQPPTPNE